MSNKLLNRKYQKYRYRYLKLCGGARANTFVNEILARYDKTPISEQTDRWRELLIERDLPIFVRHVRTEDEVLRMLTILQHIRPPLTDSEFAIVRENLRYLYDHPCYGPCLTDHQRHMVNKRLGFYSGERGERRDILNNLKEQMENNRCDICENWKRTIGDKVWTREVAKQYGELLRQRHVVNRDPEKFSGEMRRGFLGHHHQREREGDDEKEDGERLRLLRRELKVQRELERRARGRRFRSVDFRRAADIRHLENEIHILEEKLGARWKDSDKHTSQELAEQRLLEEGIDEARRVTPHRPNPGEDPISINLREEEVDKSRMEAAGLDSDQTFMSSEL